MKSRNPIKMDFYSLEAEDMQFHFEWKKKTNLSANKKRYIQIPKNKNGSEYE